MITTQVLNSHVAHLITLSLIVLWKIIHQYVFVREASSALIVIFVKKRVKKVMLRRHFQIFL